MSEGGKYTVRSLSTRHNFINHLSGPQFNPRIRKGFWEQVPGKNHGGPVPIEEGLAGLCELGQGSLIHSVALLLAVLGIVPYLVKTSFC